MISKNKKFQRDFLLQLPGYLLVCSFITAALSGLLIAFYYIPTPAKAALSISYIQENVFAGAVIITIHRVSIAAALLFTILNLIIIIAPKKISDIWIQIWQTGIVLIILIICFRITGYLLTGSNSAVYLLKTILAKFSTATSHSASLPDLFSTLPVAFVRIYILHILIIPCLAGIALYKHIKGLRLLGYNLQPITIRPIIILTAFITLVTIISILIKPTGSPVSDYTEHYLTNVPWTIKTIIWVIKALSLPVAIILSLVIVFLILSIGNILKNIKTKIATKAPRL